MDQNATLQTERIYMLSYIPFISNNSYLLFDNDQMFFKIGLIFP